MTLEDGCLDANVQTCRPVDVGLRKVKDDW
jgi:hypothetical protein